MMTRKTGIPNNKLRGVTEADFFQKNNTVDKGFTFNYDGSLIDFKKPKMRAELDEKCYYELQQETVVTKNKKTKQVNSKATA